MNQTKTILRQCRKCKRIETLATSLVLFPHDEIVWRKPPECFEPNLAVTLCLCPECEAEMKVRTE